MIRINCLIIAIATILLSISFYTISNAQTTPTVSPDKLPVTTSAPVTTPTSIPIVPTTSETSKTDVQPITGTSDAKKILVSKKALQSFNQAKSLFDKGNIDNASKILLSLTNENKEFKNAWNLLGNVHERRGKYEKAIEAYKEFLKLSVAPYVRDIDDIRVAHTNLCSANYNMGRYGNSTEDIDTALYHAELSRLMSIELKNPILEAKAYGWLGMIYRAKGAYQEAEVNFKASFDKCSDSGDNESLAYASNNVGFINFLKGEYKQAQDSFKKALQYAEKLENKTLEGTILNNLGSLYEKRGLFKEALMYFTRSVESSKKMNANLSLAVNYSFLGEFYVEKGDYAKADANFKKAEQIFKDINSPGKKVSLYDKYGDYLRIKGNLDEAKMKYEMANQISMEIGDSSYQSTNIINLGLLDYEKGNYDQALEKFNKAYEMDSKDLIPKISICLNNMGLAKLAKEKFDEANKDFQTSLTKEVDNMESKLGEAILHNNLGLILLNQKKYQEALKLHFELALNLFRQMDAKRHLASIYANIGNVYAALGQDRKAKQNYDLSFKTYKQLKSKSGLAIINNNIGYLYYRAKNWKTAKKYFEDALSNYKDIQNEIGLAICKNNLGLVEKELNNSEAAERNIREALNIFKTLQLGTKHQIALDNESAIFLKNQQKTGLKKLYEQFEKRLQEVMKTDPDNTDQRIKYLSRIADIDFIMGNYQKAINNYEEGMKYDVDGIYQFDFEAIATAYLNLKDVPKAIINFTKALRQYRDGKKKEKDQYRVALKLVEIYQNADRFDLAFTIMKGVCELEFKLRNGNLSNTSKNIIERFGFLNNQPLTSITDIKKACKDAITNFISTGGLIPESSSQSTDKPKNDTSKPVVDTPEEENEEASVPEEAPKQPVKEEPKKEEPKVEKTEPKVENTPDTETDSEGQE